MKRHHIHREALRDLDEAAGWYERAEPGLGAAFVDAYVTRLEEALARPSIGTPERIGGTVVRTFKLRRFPYVIVLVVRRSEIVVIAVAHERRRPRYWQGRIER